MYRILKLKTSKASDLICTTNTFVLTTTKAHYREDCNSVQSAITVVMSHRFKVHVDRDSTRCAYFSSISVDGHIN